jgi:hypothetical protein
MGWMAAVKLAWVAYQAASAALKKRDAAGKPKIFDPQNKRPILDTLRDLIHDGLVAYDGHAPLDPPKSA